jgi:hypothetical protein
VVVVAEDTLCSNYHSSASDTTAAKVLSPVYDPARVIADGTLIPQYVTPVLGVVVEVDFGTFNSSCVTVDEESGVPLPYDTDEVANCCSLSGIVDDAEFGHVEVAVKVGHIDSPVKF